MRKPVIISAIALAALLAVGIILLRHRADAPASLSPLSKIPVAPPARTVRTKITSARSTTRQPELEYTGPNQRDVTLGTIRMIANLNADILSRQRAVRALPKDLTPEHRKILTDFLTAPHEEDNGQAGHVLKNDIMDSLIGQQTPGRGLADLFIKISQDKNQNVVIRDYALQHLALLSERLDGPTVWDAKLVRAQQTLIQDALWQSAGVRESSTAGTALLGLTRISETHPELDKTRLSQAAIDMTATGVDEAARVTAFQVAARFQPAGALPLLLRAAQTDPSSIVRISAIGALGVIASADALPALNQIAEQTPRYKAVAERAMKKIQERTR